MAVSQHPYVPRPPRFIATVLTHAATTRGEGLRDVASAIGVDPTTLMQYRSGRRRLSMEAFAKIVAVYGGDQAICAAALNYLRAEYHPVKDGSLAEAADALPPPVVAQLRAFVERLPEEAITTGRGLYLLSMDARSLSLAAQFLVRSFEHRKIGVCHLRADRPITAAERRTVLAMPVLLVERIDFMRDPLPDLLRERANLVRPLIVTSMQAPDAMTDAHLRRVFLSLTRLLPIGEPPSAPPITHAVLPAESQQQ